MIEYEDTVMPETGPCCDCGVVVDEADSWLEDEWLCGDCASERRFAA